MKVCLFVALVAPLAGITAVRIGAQAPGGEFPDAGEGCKCGTSCPGGPAICKTIICSDGTSTTCYRAQQTQP